jgi:filamentous hemagglutinin
LVLNAGGQFRNDGSIYADTSLNLTAASFVNTGTVTGNGAGSFNLTSAFDNRASGRLDFTGPLNVIAGTVGNAGSIITQGTADFRSGTLTNDGTLAAASTLGVTATGALINHGTLAGGATTTLDAASLTNTGTIQSDTDLGITAATVSNSNSIIALSRLTLAALGSFTNSGTLVAGSDATINLGASVNNAGGTITAVNDLTLTTTATGNVRGTVAAGRDLRLNFTDYTNGAGETDFLMGRDLIVAARNLDNAGLFAGYRDLRIATTGNLTNSGQLAAAVRDAWLDVTGSFTNTGIVETGRDLTLTAASVINGTGGTTTQSFGPSLSMADYRYWVLTYITDPIIQGKLFNEITPDWQTHNSRFYLISRDAYFRDSDLNDPEFNLYITRAGGGATLNAGRNFSAMVSGSFSNNASTVQAGGNIDITAASFSNLAAQDTYEGWVFAGGGGHDLKAYGNSASVVKAGGTVHIDAASTTNTGNIDGSQVYLGGSLVNGLTSYNQPTPATTLPHAVIDLSGAPGGSPAGTVPQPAGSTFTPLAPTLFSSAAQLALLAPVGQSYLLNLLPANLRSGTAFLMDAWLEQQSLRQAALRETGQATFLAGLSYDEANNLSIDSQQRVLLYQAAAKFATENGIRLGVALSDAQQKALTSPILWYVEQTVTGPDGKSYQALVPKVYLPEGQLADMANIAGGIIKGNDVTLDAKGGRVENTGYIVANKLTVNAAEIVNRQRSASWGSYTETVKGGYLEISGDRVQPGGFMSAANMSLNASRIESISGTFLEGGADKTGQLQQQLGGNFSQSQNIDHTFVTFHQDPGSGLGQVAVMAVAMVVAYFTAGAASGAIASAAGESAAAAATAAGATAEAAAAAGTAAASAAASSVSTAMISGAVGSMASTATTGLLTGNFDMGNVLKSGLSGALTAGLTSAPLFDGQSLNQLAGIKNLAGTGASLANGDFSNLGQNLLGMAGRGVVNAGVNTVVYGGSFGNAFKQSMVSDLAAMGASAIGSKWGGGVNPVAQTVAHAGLGAIVAKARGQDAIAGAIGGITESAIDNLVGDSLPNTANAKGLYAAAATLAGGIVSNAAGRDPVAAAQAAQNAALNNKLISITQTAKLHRLATANRLSSQQELIYKAVLCASQTCSVDGWSGSVGEGQAQLQALGESIRAQSPELFAAAQKYLSDQGLLDYGLADRFKDAGGVAKDTVGAAGKGIYANAIAQNVPGLPAIGPLPSYEEAQAQMAQRLATQAEIDNGNPTAIAAAVNQTAKTTFDLTTGDSTAAGKLAGQILVVVGTAAVTKTLVGLGEDVAVTRGMAGTSNGTKPANLIPDTSGKIGSGTAAANDGSFSVSRGYTQNADGSVVGPRGGAYTPTGILDANGSQVFKDASGAYYTLDAGGGRTQVPSPYPANNSQIAQNAAKGAQSELDVGKTLPSDARYQVSYKNGVEVPNGTPGSVRPDFCIGTACSIEVKNYNVATNADGLISNVSQQAVDRAANLPKGMTQTVVIDVRGQMLSAQQADTIVKGIVQKSNGAISPTDIRFKTQ